MDCPFCQCDMHILETRIIQSSIVRRRRECTHCGKRITTHEHVVTPKVKENGKRQVSL